MPPLGAGFVTCAVGSGAVSGPIGVATGADTVGALAITVSGAVGSIAGVGRGATVCTIFGACATGRTFVAAAVGSGAGAGVGGGSGRAQAMDTSSAMGVLGLELLLMPHTKAIPSTA
jgi:hypothetical protein